MGEHAGLRNGYVVGFAFDADALRVMLIRKNRPQWQAGKLNGVGGKIEDGETPAEAMAREFAEETGIETTADSWDYLLEYRWDGGCVYFYRTFLRDVVFDAAISTTDEQLWKATVAGLRGVRTIPNLQWLVPLAAHTHDRYVPFVVVEAP